jgi:hypothetical protein
MCFTIQFTARENGRRHLQKGVPMPHNQVLPKGETINEKLIHRIAESLKGLKFGHVLITVHNHKVVQIDRTERNRCEMVVQEIDGGGI